MSSRNYETQILDSIQMIVDNAISKADFDKTIKAVINEASNSADGEYIVSYQGSLLVAYSSNLDVHYTKGMEVYVLIPGNDNSQRKTIIGAVDNYGLDYTSLLEGDASYDTIGKNIVNSDKTFELCSYNKEETKILYHRDNNINAIGYNSEDFETYIKNAEYLICGATFKTALPLEQQLQGDYGIAFDIDYKIDNETITKTYIVNTSKMIGAPYSLATDTRQYEIFNIDTNNILSVKQIYIFAYNFPNIEAGQPNDIFVSKIELLAAAKITEEELNSIALSIITPQGTYFNTQDTDEAIRNMEAQIKIKGRILNNTEDVKYYWFRENSLISNNHRLYNRLSGAGWECLNESNASGVDFMTVEWVPGSSSFSTTKHQNVAKETKYKCIAIYNKDTVLQKDFTITNYDSDYEISILSNQGMQFYHNNGKPTLTCYINGIEDKSDEYLYVWSSIDNNNTFNSLVETTTINDEYNTAKAGYDALIKEIEEEKKLVAATQDQLTEYSNTIEKYKYTTRVEKNIIWNIDLRTISFFKTFKCSVFKNSVFIGTASVVITNDLTTNLNYTLVINNGNQVFKYNEAGVAPNSSSLKNPIEILPLSFTLYDKDGKEVDQSTIESNNIFWTLPLIHTLVKKPSLYQNIFEETKEYVTYYGYKDLNFDISSQYSISNSNNDIDLKVIYQGQTIAAKTNLTFTKTGEVGTNGTDYMCKIVPNVANGTVLNIDPTVILNEATQTYELSYPVAENNIWFKLQLWKNGELVFNDNQSGYSEEGSEVKLEWSMLKNNYGQKNVDKSNFNVNKNTGEFSVDVTKYNNPANIVKCAVKYNGVEYFATMPIITARIKNFNYDISLIKDSGFREVVYSSDGRYPSYDDRKPFEIQVKEKINEKFEDISLLTKDYAVDYEWSTKGEVYYSYWQSISNLKIKKLYASKEKRNQKYFEPKESYNGLAVNNAVECLVSRNEEALCSIHIPVYCYLNRYGNAAINGWDGNSISIDEDNSGMILAPQIGAGSKNDDNSFTGIFMGSVKAQGEIKEEHGLFGYNAGQRTIALNAADGSARFGIEGKGQIVLDPATGDAILTSGNYSEEAGTGMEINLSKPSIRFGSGKFGVNSSGQVFADGFATTEYVDGEVKKVTETIEKIEGAAKVLEVQLNTNTITIPCTADYIPLESKTYKINYTVLFCGRDVEDDYSITVREEITKGLGMNLSTLGEISISAYKTQGVEKDISDFTFDFTYIDGFDTYTIEKKISVVLAPQGKDGKDGSSGTDGKSAYQLWLEDGHTGTEQEFLDSLKGKDGEPGKDGQDAEIPVTIKDCEGTELVIEDGKKIIDFRIDGKSTQKTRSGKNKFKKQGLSTPSSDTTFWDIAPNPTLYTQKENGWANLTQENLTTANTYLNIPMKTSALDIKPNTQYTYIIEFDNVTKTNNNDTVSRLALTQDGGGIFTSARNVMLSSIANGRKFKFLFTTISDLSSVNLFYPYLNLFNNSVSFDVRIMIVEGDYTNTDIEYEEYGVSPSPDYPSEIKSVGHGNLLKEVFRQGNFAGAVNNIRLFTDDNYYLEKGKVYTFSTNIVDKDIKYGIITAFVPFPTPLANRDYDSGWQTVREFTFTVPNSGYFGMSLAKNVDTEAISLSDIDGAWFMLNEGTKAIPYGKYEIEVVNTGKNRLPNNPDKTSTNGVTVTKNKDGSITLNGTSTTNSWVTIAENLRLNTNTYTLSLKNKISGLGIYLGSDSATTHAVTQAQANDYKTFTLSEETVFDVARIRIISGTVFNNLTIYPMLETGIEKTEFELYFKNSTVFLLNEPLRSLPNGVKDVAYLKNGKLHIERRVGKVVFNGTETWSYDAQGSAGDTTVYGAKTLVSNYIGNDKFVTDIGNINLQANKFKITHTFSKSAEGMNGGWGKYIYVKLFATRLSTLSDSAVKTFFAENNTEVIYELDTLTIEEYDPIYTIPMHEEKIDIYYVNDELTPNTYCKYYTIYAGIDGAPGKDGETPAAIKDCEGTELVIKDGKQIIDFNIYGKSEQETRAETKVVRSKNRIPTDFYDWESGNWDMTTGNKADYPTRLRTKRLIKVSPSRIYYVKTAAYYDFVIREYDGSKNFIGTVSSLSAGSSLAGSVFTTKSTTSYISVTLYEGIDYATFQSKWDEVKPFICLNEEPNKTYSEHKTEYSVGKNLFDYMEGFLSSNCGITSVLNPDHSITTSGVPTINWNSVCTVREITDILDNGEKYTISQKEANQYLYLQITMLPLNSSESTVYISSFNGPITFTVDKSKYTYHAKIQCCSMADWGTGSRTITNTYQLEKGSTATSFEKYGVSPSPDYPSEIVSLGYENLFKPTLVGNDGVGIMRARCSAEINGDVFKITATGSDAYVGEAASTVGTAYTGVRGYLMDVTGATCISYKLSNPKFEKNYITAYDENLKSIKTNEKRSSEGVHILPAGTKYITVRFGISNSVAGETYETTVQIEKGSVIHSYVSYGKYGYEIMHEGKNKFDFANENNYYASNQPIKLTKIDNGIRAYNNSGTNYVWGTYLIKDFKHLLGKTLTFSYTAKANSTNEPAVRVYWFDLSTNMYKTNIATFKNTSGGKITLPSNPPGDNYCLAFFFYSNYEAAATGECYVDYINIQLEEGSTATEFEPYRGTKILFTLDEPLRGIPNSVRDVATIQNGILRIERKVGYKQIKSTMVQNFINDLGISKEARVDKYTIGNVSSKDGFGLMSNTFRKAFTWNVDKIGIMFNAGTVNEQIAFRIPIDATGTYFDDNSTYIIYELETPYIEEIGPVYIPMEEGKINSYHVTDQVIPDLYSRYGTIYAGLNGQSIYSVTDEFYVSNSKTTLTGGSWSEIMPTWSTGKYLWTRSKIIYSNPTDTEYTEPMCDSSWEAVNELQIGGRNILYNSSFSEDFDEWYHHSTISIVEKNGRKCAHINHAEFGLTKTVSQNIFGRLEPNTSYTMSGWVLFENLKLGPTNPTCMFYHDGSYNNNGTPTWYGFGSKPLNTTGEPGVWHQVIWTFTTDEVKCKNATTSTIYVHTRDITGDLYFYNLKLEKGNKVTDWTPAPEDTIIEMAGLQTQIDGKIQSYSQTSDPSSSWTTTELKTQHSGDLWYNPDTKKTQRWSGTAWVNLENAEAQAAATLAGKKAQVFTSQPKPPYYIGDLWITALNQTGVVKTCKQARASGSYVSTDWVEGLKYTDDSTVNNLKIGGRNLALKTNQGLTYWGWSTSDGVVVKEEYIDPDDGVKGVKFTCTTASTSWSFIQYSLPKSQIQLLEPKTEYTISFDIKSNLGVRNTYMQIQQGNATNGLTNQGLYQIKGNETWEHAVYKITTKDSLSGLDLNSQLLYFTGINKIGYVIIKNLKLEKGNVATAWTPAPEDTSAQVTEQIQGLDTNGRNFILKSQNEQAATLTTAGGQAYIDYDFSNILKTLTEYKTFTISADIKGTAANMTFDFYFRNSSENSFTSPINYWQVGTELKRYSQVITVNSGSTVADIDKLRFRLNSVGTVSLFNVKLEVGEKSTIWTPAPEDAIKKMTIYYTISSSKDQIRDEKGNLITNINWGTSAQATEKMPYIWQMTQIEYIEGAAQDGTPICITAMERYATKNSLQYLASDHAKVTDEDKASNKWSYTRPKLSLATPYMLIRTEIIWSNAPDKPEYINYYCDEDAYTLQTDINTRANNIINDLETGYVKIYKNQIVVSSQEWTKEAMIAQTLPNTFSAIIIGNQGIATYKRQNEDNSLNAWPTWDEEAQRWAGNFNSVWGTDGTIDAQAVNVKNVRAESIISGVLTLTNKNADGKIYIKDENGLTTVEATGDGVIISLTGANNAGGRIEITADKGFRAIDKGGMVSFGSSADNSTFEMNQAKVIKYIDFGEYLRGIVFPTDSSSTAHKGLGFIRK